MKITESRANDILRWLDDETGNHALLFEKMTLHRDAAALIRQLQAADGTKDSLLREAARMVRELDAAEQATWHAGLDAGREQGRRNRLAEAATHKRELDSAGAFHFSDNGDDIEARFVQQPAAVDGAMVERAARAFGDEHGGYRVCRDKMHAALTAALAQEGQ